MCDVRRLVFSARDPWIHVVGVVGQDMYERVFQVCSGKREEVRHWKRSGLHSNVTACFVSAKQTIN